MHKCQPDVFYFNGFSCLIRSIVSCECVVLSLFNNYHKLRAAVAVDEESVECCCASGRVITTIESYFNGGGCKGSEDFVHFFRGVWHVVIEPPGYEGE